jgi:mono/diheme cytochrome c family protein
MRNTSIRPGGLNTLRLLQVVALLTVVFLLVLASAPLRPYLSEWRSVQQDYNRLARATGSAPIPIAIKQIWRPALGVTDRCTTCHLGMGGAATPIAGERLFAAHPPIPHDPREYGCTVCHGGQGRATTKDAAHGFVSHWDEQILDRSHLGAGCATCHDQFPGAPRAVLAQGQKLVEQLDCLSCHRIDGRGRGDAPDLTYVGLKGYAADWYTTHLSKHEAGATDAWRASFGPIAAADLEVIGQWLSTRVGAPAVVEARALAAERGCLGCHKLNGVGGEEGPALDVVGRKPVGELNFANVKGPRTFTNYMREHLIDPAGVFPGSTMLAQDYTPAEIELLLNWVLSLRTRDVPTAYLPKDRVQRRVLNVAPPPKTAEENFAMYCSACHGPSGAGRTYGASEARFPAIGTADFLNVASDDFIVRTLASGRPNRRMPAMGASGAALDQTAVTSLVAMLRARLGTPPSLASLTALPADDALGARVYHDDCAACHGERGEGTALGSPLAAADRALPLDRAYEALVKGVARTAMPAYSDRPPASLAAVLRYMQALPRTGAARASWAPGAGDADRGADLYNRHCVGCHGPNGEGKVGPALANPAFLQAATTEFVATTIVRGRAGTPMPSFGRDSVGYGRLTGSEALDLAAFIRERLGNTPRVTGVN